MIKHVHNGVTDYVNKICHVTRGNLSSYNVSKNRTLKTYLEFIQSPHQSDAMLFNGLSFVDQFGGSDARYIIASPMYPEVNGDNYFDYIRDSWWREGASALVNGSTRTKSNLDFNSFKATDKKINEKKISIFQRKLRKLKNNPASFWYDSNVRKVLLRRA